MPQFDKVSFFTQTFWLILLFFSFYMLLLKTFIPNLSRIIKTRIKKLKLGQSIINILKEEKSDIFLNSNLYVYKKIQNTRNSGLNHIQFTIDWLLNSIKTTNKSNLLGINNIYIKDILRVSSINNLVKRLF
jgi:hypothetical protein